jgi:hypothetical protein
MNLPYLIPRTIRHFMPEGAVRFLLRHGMIIRPGLETSEPGAAIRRYQEIFDQEALEFQGLKVLVFGYGGGFAVGCGLLAMGAEQAVLIDPYALPDDRRNQALWPRYEKYLLNEGGRMSTRPEFMPLIKDDIRKVSVQEAVKPADLVVSSSVYEHLDDVGGITRALAAVTASGGLHIHFIDLRDHFFKYPFEMLMFSETNWDRWLNPSSNHNRFRLDDYRRVFERSFAQVDITVLSRDREAFAQARPRIRPEFLTGDPEVDSITSIQVLARQPRGGNQSS